MKIGVLTHNYPRHRGDFSGRFVEALSEELVRQGHAVTVLAPWDPAYARLPSDHTVNFELYRYAPRDDWHRLGYMRTMRADVAMRPVTYALGPALFLAGSLAVMRWAARERPDVLHAHWVLPNGFIGAIAARRYRIPLVVSIPGSDATVAGQSPIFRRMARFAFDTAGLVTANASQLRDVAVAGLGADPARFELIAYGVDPDALHPDPAGVAELRASLAIPADAVVVLAVGRMVYKKGFDKLLRAAAALHAQSQPAEAPVHLVMIGDGDLWQDWQSFACELGLGDTVHWVGSVPTDRIGVYYNMADILASPSVTRPATGLGVTVLDAMSCAKPILGTDAAGNTLAVEHGLNGLIVPEGDVPALAGALRILALDPALRMRMGQAGRRRIDTELGWPHLARRYATHFARLISAQPQISGTA